MTVESRNIFLKFFAGYGLVVAVIAGINLAAIGPTEEQPWRTFRPTPGDVHEGRRIMERNGCFSCHAVHGFGGDIGPELSGVTVRKYRGELYDWIRKPGEIKPGTRMPTFALSQGEILRIISYLEALDTIQVTQ